MIASHAHRAQREADAAQFEDWSAWPGLVYLFPEWGVIEIRPRSSRADALTRQIPGITRSRRHGHLVRDGLTPPWHLPLDQWRALKAALPAIKAVDDAAAAKQVAIGRAADTRLAVAIREATEARLAALRKPPAERSIGERVEVIVTAYLMRDRRLTAWERDFAVDIGNRWHRVGDRLALSDRQRAIVERIHDKVADTAIL